MEPQIEHVHRRAERCGARLLTVWKPHILSRNNRGEGKIVEDQTVFHRINELAGEEHEIWRKESQGEATEADRERLRRIQVTLDQCWDLLHQRQARRAAGLNPDEAKVRDEKIVEGYIG